MTKRYFYTCRIKAAFMAMYHDMVFGIVHFKA